MNKVNSTKQTKWSDESEWEHKSAAATHTQKWRVNFFFLFYIVFLNFISFLDIKYKRVSVCADEFAVCHSILRFGSILPRRFQWTLMTRGDGGWRRVFFFLWSTNSPDIIRCLIGHGISVCLCICLDCFLFIICLIPLAHYLTILSTLTVSV